jgi:hypothetical protein
MNIDEALLVADDAHTSFMGHLEGLRVLATKVREQHAEIEALRKDAARYRYLRNRQPADVLDRFGQAAGVWIDMESDKGRLVLLTGDDADTAVDAAMSKQGEST